MELMKSNVFRRIGDGRRGPHTGKMVDFAIISRDEAEQWLDYDTVGNRKYVVISIHGSDESPAKIKLERNVLYLQFDDIEQGDLITQGKHTFLPFTKHQAKKIFDFVNEHEPDFIIVHCHAGICRSAAVAAALSKIMFNEDDDIFKAKVPNMWVYKTMLEYYFCDVDTHEGEYINKVYFDSNYHKYML